MNLRQIRIAMAAALVFAGVSMANAQVPATLGEPLDKGGKRLSSAELKALLGGATTLGTTYSGQVDFETKWAEDGTASGRTCYVAQSGERSALVRARRGSR